MAKEAERALASPPSRERMLSDLSESSGTGNAMPSRQEMLDFLDPMAGSQVKEISETQSKVQEIAKRQRQKMQPVERLPAPEPARPEPVQVKKEIARVNVPNLNNVLLEEAGYSRDSDLVMETFKTDKMLGLPMGASLAQLYQESALDPKARSKAGAMGLAQVIPSTQKALEERFGRKLDPFNEMDAILIHREVMRENMAKFKTWEKALKAYNAGWDTKRWGRTKENREYVGRIKGWLNRLIDRKSESKASEKPKPRPIDNTIPVNRKPLL